MFNRQTGAFALAKPRPPLICWLMWGLWPLFFSTSTIHAAADAPARIESIQVGFRGVVEVGRWSPIAVQVSGTAGTEVTLRVTAADSEGRRVRQSEAPVVLSGGSTVLSLVYQHGPLNSPVVVELLQGDKLLAERIVRPSAGSGALQTVTQDTDFVVCLGERLLGFELASQIASETRKSRPDRVAPLLVQHYSPEQLNELPTDARGWEAIDVCVISSKCEIPETLGTTLTSWVRQGGRLVLIGGEEVTSAGSPGLSGWLPVQLNGEATLHDITALNVSIAGSATLRLREGSLHTMLWTTEGGAILTRCLDGPLVIRTGESLGTVTAIALDINAMPFTRVTDDHQSLAWDSLPDLCRWLAGLPLIQKLEEGSQRPQSDLNPTGVSDLQTQLVNTLDQFPEIVRPSYWVVLGAALLFLVIVSPLDYLLVHRVLRRPHWTWVTLPIWIGLGGVIGLTAATRTGGANLLTRQLDLVTWDAVRNDVQLDSWLTIFSPEHHRYEVGSQPGAMYPAPQAETQLRWAGRPEAGFRGLYRETDIGNGAVVEMSDGGRAFRALPIRFGSSSVLEAKSRWEQQLAVTSELRDMGDGHLRGTVSHQLDGELVDWVMVYGSFAYMPSRSDAGVEKPWLAGETVYAERIPSRLISDYLVRMSTRVYIKNDEQKSKEYSMSRQEYDPLSRDLLTLMRTVSFHELAGGRSYTDLGNATLQSEDLSRLIDSHRAVMFGRIRNSAYVDADMSADAKTADEPLATQFTVDGKPVSPRYRECFIRWILPVKQSAEPLIHP